MPIHSMGFKYEPMVGSTHSGSTGELWIDLDTGILRLGTNNIPGGSTFVTTQPNGVNDMGGGLWVGNIKDDSVVWASEDSEYLGLWWAGNRDISQPGYGAYAAINVGAHTPDDMDNEYPPDTQINLAIGSDYTWTFGANGSLTFPNDSFIQEDIEGTGFFGVESLNGFAVLTGAGATKQWTFGSDGNLKIPGDITSVTDTSISVGGDLLQNVVVRTVDELVPPGNVWRLFILDSVYPTLGASISVGEIVTTAWGTPVTATITSIEHRDGDWQIHVNQDIRAGFDAGPKTVTFGSESKNWTFGLDGNLTFPNNSTFDGQTLTDHATGTNYTLKIANGGSSGTKFGIGTGNAAFGIANDALNHAEDSYVPYSVTAQRINLTVLGAGSWVFGSDGSLTVPGQIKTAVGTGAVTIQSNDGATTRTWTFGTNGTLTLPTGGGSGADDEGAEIDFTKAPNSTLSGNSVVVDQYIDRLRFFESGGTSRGAYIDLKQAAAGVGTLLNNRVSAFVNAGTFVTMDNIKATVTTSSNRGLSLATVSGTATCFISGTFGMFGGATVGGASAGVALTTTPSVSIFSWNFGSEGDTATYILNDGYTKSYRITMMIGGAYNNNMISIERLI